MIRVSVYNKLLARYYIDLPTRKSYQSFQSSIKITFEGALTIVTYNATYQLHVMYGVQISVILFHIVLTNKYLRVTNVRYSMKI